MEMAALFEAEKTFYRVGVSVEEARLVLDEQLSNLKEMARFFVAHISASVVGDERALTNRTFVEGIELDRFTFDPEQICERYAACEGDGELYEWSFDPRSLQRFNPAATETGLHPPPAEDAAAAASLAEQEVAI